MKRKITDRMRLDFLANNSSLFPVWAESCGMYWIIGNKDNTRFRDSLDGAISASTRKKTK